LEEEVRRAEEHREPSQAVWAAYWGYDSCGPGGILDRLFSALRIPQKSWGGLKRLPEVGGIAYERRHSYMHLVSNFLQVPLCMLPLKTSLWSRTSLDIYSGCDCKHAN